MRGNASSSRSLVKENTSRIICLLIDLKKIGRSWCVTKQFWGGGSCVTNLDQTKDKLQFFTPMLYEILVLVISWSQPHFWRQGVVYVPSISNCCFGVANIVKKYQEKITQRKRIHVKRETPRSTQKILFFSRWQKRKCTPWRPSIVLSRKPLVYVYPRLPATTLYF